MQFLLIQTIQVLDRQLEPCEFFKQNLVAKILLGERWKHRNLSPEQQKKLA